MSTTWTIKTKKHGTNTRALCPIDGCNEYREHADSNTAAKFITGHLVAKHAEDGVQASDQFSVK